MNWLLTYKDKISVEETTIYNNGKILSTVIRGVTFSGIDFDSLKAERIDETNLISFSLNDGELCNCELECKIPIAIQDNEELMLGNLEMILELGKPYDNGGLDKENLKLILTFKNYYVESPGISGWFEDELVYIQEQLTDGVYLKACINCAYSDYSPYGHGLFGGMMCFRNMKIKYLNVTSKDELLSIHDDYEELVQETYICKEFDRRRVGSGYRG